MSEILNKAQLDAWLNERRELNHDCVSAKGMVDGELVNIAWQDTTTKEVFAIEYGEQQPEGEK